MVCQHPVSFQQSRTIKRESSEGYISDKSSSNEAVDQLSPGANQSAGMRDVVIERLCLTSTREQDNDRIGFLMVMSCVVYRRLDLLLKSLLTLFLTDRWFVTQFPPTHQIKWVHGDSRVCCGILYLTLYISSRYF